VSLAVQMDCDTASKGAENDGHYEVVVELRALYCVGSTETEEMWYRFWVGVKYLLTSHMPLLCFPGTRLGGGMN
jgi:hypothetical protein